MNWVLRFVLMLPTLCLLSCSPEKELEEEMSVVEVKIKFGQPTTKESLQQSELTGSFADHCFFINVASGGDISSIWGATAQEFATTGSTDSSSSNYSGQFGIIGSTMFHSSTLVSGGTQTIVLTVPRGSDRKIQIWATQDSSPQNLTHSVSACNLLKFQNSDGTANTDTNWTQFYIQKKLEATVTLDSATASIGAAEFQLPQP